jgi:hypothetical protein
VNPFAHLAKLEPSIPRQAARGQRFARVTVTMGTCVRRSEIGIPLGSAENRSMLLLVRHVAQS